MTEAGSELGEYKVEYLALSREIAEVRSIIENKEDEILSITDRIDELLDERAPAHNPEIARAREKRSRLREECVDLRRDCRTSVAERDWLLVQARIIFGGPRA